MIAQQYWWSAAFLVAVPTFAGCNGSKTPAGGSTPTTAAGPSLDGQSSIAGKPATEWTAAEILQQLLKTYRQAKTYQDQAVVRLQFRQGGQPVNQEWPTSISFERPAKLSIVAYQATVKCDGKELIARIEDPATNNVDQQVVMRSAPAEFKLADLASDALLYDILSSRLRRQPIQLELLLESGGLVSAFAADVACQRLTDDKHEGRACFRVEVPSPGGNFVFWVDQADFLLRRLDYPAATLVSDLAADSSVSDLRLFADLRDASIDGPIAATQFTLAIPPNAKRMKSFVVPPPPLPTALLGKQPASFSFTQLDGSRLGDRDLLGKTTVLVWYHDHPACAATLAQVSLARERVAGKAGVAFFAVATDPTATTVNSLKQRLASWNAELPIVRDLEAFGDKSFHIEVQPTIVVLDKQGKLQIFQAGGNPELANQLVTIVERLERGDDLAAEIVSRHEREARDYQDLIARGGADPGSVVELPEAVIRRRTEPAKFKLKPLWTCREIKSAGNLLVVPEKDSGGKLFVIDGWRTVAELDASGKVKARHELDLPEQGAITFLRAAGDGKGKQFYAASAPLAPQMYLFDDQWRRVLAFPMDGSTPLHVVDLALADLGEAGGPLDILAASVGDVGVVAVSSDGKLLWRNRAIANAVSVAAGPADDVGPSRYYVTGEQGAILPLNRFGNEEPLVTVGKWAILRLFGNSSSPKARATLLGLANNAKGEPFAVGLDGELKECWNYPLPAGVHQKPIEPVTSSHMLTGHEGEWWLAGPDGSIHLITADGRLFDSFQYGAALTGLAAGTLAGKPTLVLVTGDEIAAFEVTVPTPKKAREF